MDNIPVTHRGPQVYAVDMWTTSLLPTYPQPCNLSKSTKEPQGGAGIVIKLLPMSPDFFVTYVPDRSLVQVTTKSGMTVSNVS